MRDSQHYGTLTRFYFHKRLGGSLNVDACARLRDTPEHKGAGSVERLILIPAILFLSRHTRYSLKRDSQAVAVFKIFESDVPRA